MTITIELPPEIETRVQREAERRGLNTSRYIVEAIEQHLRITPEPPARLSGIESDLLQEINRGLPHTSWQRYHELIDERRAESLTPAGQTELIALSDQIEQANVRRVQALIELARLRRTSVAELMQSLGIDAPGYA